MHRVLAAGFTAGGVVELPGDESHHLSVRRARAGERVELLDGAGLVGAGHLLERGRGWAVEVEEVRSVPAPAPARFLVGAGDRDRFGWLVEKLVELGATDLVPVETERSRAVATRIRDGQLDRLTRRAAEALKQSGGAWALRVHPVVELTAALERVAEPVRWVAEPAGEAPGETGQAGVVVAIGPEGGLTAPERARTAEAGFVPVRLGPRTLRFETAALAAATLIGLHRERAR